MSLIREAARYDLIYATFEHQIVTDNAAEIIAALKPGGMVIIEGFQEDATGPWPTRFLCERPRG